MTGASRPGGPFPPEESRGKRFDSWKEIAAYLKRDVRTIQRWEGSEGMPVHRHQHLQRNSVYAYQEELDRWWLHRGEPQPAHRKRWRWKRWAVGILAASGVAIALVALTPSAPAPVRSYPLTGAPGVESSPVFSPDGTQAAYLWQRPREKGSDVYVKQLDGGEPVPLTRTPGQSEHQPVWSPDGRWLAYFGAREGGFYLLIVPSAGGAERRVYEQPWSRGPQAPGLAWSPDGQELIAPVVEGEHQLSALYAVRRDTGTRQRLLEPPPGTSDILPEVSAGRRTLAFMRVGGYGSLRQVMLARLSEQGRVMGKPWPLAGVPGAVERFSWAGDEDEILYSTAYAAAAATSGFWTIRTDRRGLPKLLLPVPGVHFLEGRLSRDRKRLAFWAIQTAPTGYWRVNLGAGAARESPALEIPASGGLNVALAPDGQRFAYASNRGGGREIWVSRIDGSAPRRINDAQGEKCGSPRWSPDGERIAYDATSGDGLDIFVARNGEAPVRLTAHPAEDFNPSWSSDGRWLYFTSLRTGGYQIWKLPAAGGPEQQLTVRGGFGGVESPDGRYFYYTTAYSGGELRRVPAWGGPEEMVHPRIREVHDLRASARALYFLEPCARCDGREEPYVLLRYPFPGGPVEPAARFGVRVRMGFDVAQDDSFILINGLRAPAPVSRNILMVEGLR